MADTIEGTPAAPSLPRYNAERIGFTAGVIASLVMLLAIVVLRLLSGVLSLPEVVAEGLLLVIPGALFSAVLDNLQHAAKPLFYLSVGIGMIIVGGLLGRWYGGKPGWPRIFRIVLGVWLVFGIGVYTILGAGILGQHLAAGPIWHGISLLIVFAVFGVALYESYAWLERRALHTTSTDLDRRLFLRNAAAVLIATFGAGAIWRIMSNVGGGATTASAPIGASGTPAAARAANPAPYDLPGMSPEITATSDFYTVSKNFIDPQVAVAGWRLKIDGLVDNPMELTYEQLTALPASDGYYTLMCISNEVGGDLWGNAHWRGVKLKYLLEQAGVHTDAFKAMFTAADDYKDSVKLANALDPDALLAWEMNGEPLKAEHGYPARLLIPGIYGMKNVKWLTGISIINDDFKGFWQNQGWDDSAPYQTASRIDAPSGRESVPPGTLPVGGVAFAGNRGIQSVEVSTDNGQTWLAAQVKSGLSGNSWQLWRADIPVDSSTKSVRVRATDGLGHPQTREIAPPFPSGSTGYHTIDIAVTNS
jgi:DMSO/TMAO reductase YedYZ molybdopterin-dependent catalytic subunit